MPYVIVRCTYYPGPLWSKMPMVPTGDLGDGKEEGSEDLAPSYLPTGLPQQYCHRNRVSPPSSGWIGVFPLHLGHQDSDLFYPYKLSLSIP